jgi:hypothetical protein
MSTNRLKEQDKHLEYYLGLQMPIEDSYAIDELEKSITKKEKNSADKQSMRVISL